MRLLVNIGTIIFFLLGIALAGNALSYLNFDPHYSFLNLKQSAIATGWYLPAYYSHVFLGGIILVLGFVQVNENIRKKYVRLHRISGYIYVIGILFFSAPGGLVMALFIDRGPWVLASFLLQGTLWFYFTGRAFSEIKRGHVQEHQAFMYRSFSLTLAAITLRIYIFFSSFEFNLAQPGAYATIAWLSWTLNLLVAEWLIRSRSISKPTSPSLR